MNKLVILFGLDALQIMNDMFLEFGYINRESLVMIRQEKNKIM